MIVHERDEWLAGYQVAAGEGSAWWGGPVFEPALISNITAHYPGGSSGADVPVELRAEQAAYHRRSDGNSGRPAPFTHGYDLGYNAMIDPAGEVWKVRWLEQRCAANGSVDANRVSFAVQFMMPAVDSDVTAAQIAAARELDRYLRNVLPNIAAGAAGWTPHQQWFPTACPGANILAHLAAGDFVWRDQPLEDKMQIRFRDSRYANVFVLPDGATVGPRGSAQFDQLPLVEETHDATLADCCWKAWGLSVDAAKAAGLLVAMPI